MRVVVLAWRRLTDAWGLVLALAMAMWMVATGWAWWIRTIAAAALDGYGPLDHEHVGYALEELLTRHPDLVATMRAAAWVSAALGIAVGWFTTGGILVRLHERCTVAELAAACVEWAPRVAVVTLFHLVMRVVLLMGLYAVVRPVGQGVTVVVMFLGTTICTYALDRARIHVVLEHGHALHPRTAVLAFWPPTVHLPTVLFSMLFAGLQWLAVLGLPAAAMATSGSAGAPWVLLAFTLAIAVLGVSRLAVLVEGPRPPLLRRPIG